MRLLALECSAKAASCALLEDGRLIAHDFLSIPSTHSQTLLPMAAGMLGLAGVGASEIDAFAVSSGPGSFTGVRIGVSAVKGMALAGGKPCIGVSSLLAAAYSAPYDSGLLCAAMDARCGQVYAALFRRAGDSIERLCEDKAVQASELCEELAKLSGSILLIGDGAGVVAASENCPPDARLAPEAFRVQNALGVALAAWPKLLANETVSAADLLPVYLRLPQAERELKLKQGAVL